MYILQERHYRQKLRPEHWDEFVQMISDANPEPPTASVAAQANLDMLQHYSSLRLMDKYPDDYPIREQEDEDDGRSMTK